MIDETLFEAEEKMEKAVEVAKEAFAGIRTGRAHPGMFQKVLVDYYGAPDAAAAARVLPEPRGPHDHHQPVRQGLDARHREGDPQADLGVNPSNDGTIIRCVMPVLTEERRREYVKMAHHQAEDAKVSVRNIRRHAKTTLEKLVKDGEVGEDEGSRPRRSSRSSRRRTSTRSTSCSSTRKPSSSRSDLAATMTDSRPDTDADSQQAAQPDGGARTPEESRRRSDSHAPAKPPKAGRNLPAAVAVGLLLAALVIGTLVVDARAFLGVVVLAVALGAWELRRAIATKGIGIPLIPLLLGTAGMLVSAYLRGAEALVVTFGLTMIGLLVWRVADGLAGAARDLGASALVVFYPVFLAGFAALMLAAPDGRRASSCSSSSRSSQRHRRVCRGRHGGPPPDGPVAQPEEVVGGLRRVVVTWPSWAPLRCRCCSGACGGRAPCSARWPPRGHPRRPRRVEHQARPRGQGHGDPSPGARRHDGPAGLAPRRGADRLGLPHLVRPAGLSRHRSGGSLAADLRESQHHVRDPCRPARTGPAHVRRPSSGQAAAPPRRPHHGAAP